MAKNESKKKEVALPQKDDLAQTIADSLNKLFKDDGQVAFFLDGSEETPMDLTEFVSTGATMLDLAVSNRPHGGIAIGRITELNGLEGSGKSLVACSIIKSVQKMGGIGVLIDTEIATNKDFLKAQGIDLNKLVIVNTHIIEDIFDAVTNIIEKIRSVDSENKKPVAIVIDSIAGSTTRRENEADFAKDGYATDKAIIIGKAMRKITVMLGRQRIALITTNQLRQKMNAQPFADQWTTSGGKAIAFHASTRIRFSQMGKIKDNDGNVIGVTVKANVIKNRLGPPHREATFDIYFNRGIDDYSSWLEVMKENKLIKQAGPWYTYTDDSGNEVKFQSKDFRKFIEEDAARKETIYNAICEAVIMKYNSDVDPDSVKKEEGEDDE
jgi:recombination protein RecA